MINGGFDNAGEKTSALPDIALETTQNQIQREK